MNVNFEYYRIFYYVAKYHNFTKAAHALGSSQPNVTRAMNCLEQQINTTLFVRTNRGIQLTPEGEKLYTHISAAMSQIFAAEEELSDSTGLSHGSIAIGVSETALNIFLFDKLKAFHMTYPGIRLKLYNHSTPQAIDALEKGLVDIAMVTSPLEIRKPLRKTALRSYHDILIGGSAYKTTASRKRSLKELADFSFVSLSAGTGTNDLYVRFFYENHLRFSPDMEVATTDQILPMVRCNLGIGFCPEGIARPAIERKEVFEIELEEEIPERQITIVEDSGKPQSIAVQKLLTYFK